MQNGTTRKRRRDSLAAMAARLFGQNAPREKLLKYRPVRVYTDLPVRWGWGEEEREGRLRNLSEGGCYVEDERAPSVGDPVTVELSVPDLPGAELTGLVVRSKRGEGFAVRFRGLGEAERVLLVRAVWHLSPKLNVRDGGGQFRARQPAVGKP